MFKMYVFVFVQNPLLKENTTETVITGLEEPDSALKKKKEAKEDKVGSNTCNTN